MHNSNSCSHMFEKIVSSTEPYQSFENLFPTRPSRLAALGFGECKVHGESEPRWTTKEDFCSSVLVSAISVTLCPGASQPGYSSCPAPVPSIFMPAHSKILSSFKSILPSRFLWFQWSLLSSSQWNEDKGGMARPEGKRVETTTAICWQSSCPCRLAQGLRVVVRLGWWWICRSASWAQCSAMQHQN